MGSIVLICHMSFFLFFLLFSFAYGPRNVQDNGRPLGVFRMLQIGACVLEVKPAVRVPG